MKMDPATVRTLARDFVKSKRAQLWTFVTADVQHALIDAVVMDHVRMADIVENQTPFTPADLVALRDALIAELRRGVPFGSAGRRHLTIDT